MTPCDAFALASRAWPTEQGCSRYRFGKTPSRWWRRSGENWSATVIHVDIPSETIGRLKIKIRDRVFRMAVGRIDDAKAGFTEFDWIGEPPSDADLVEFALLGEFFE